MFKTILIPLDGSTRAEAALPVAARIAQNSRATLVLVRVVSLISNSWPTLPTSYPSMVQAAVETDLEEAAAYLERIASSPILEGIPIKTTAQFGPIAPTILSVATSYTSDLIVLCSHGSTGMIHWVLGSIAEKIARHASLPVLVIREEGTYLGRTPADLDQPLRLMVPLDGSTGAQAALEPGATLLTAMAAPGQHTALHLVRVIPAQRDHQADMRFSSITSELARVKNALQQTMEQLKDGQIAPTVLSQQIPLTSSIILDTDVAGALLRAAEQGAETEGTGIFSGCELIAMSTRGRSGLQRWVLGSMTERVLHATKRPILIVHPPVSANGEAAMVAGEQLASGAFVCQ